MIVLVKSVFEKILEFSNWELSLRQLKAERPTLFARGYVVCIRFKRSGKDLISPAHRCSATYCIATELPRWIFYRARFGFDLLWPASRLQEALRSLV